MDEEYLELRLEHIEGAPFEKILGLLIAINDVYLTMGGSSLNFHPKDVAENVIKLAASESRGMPIENGSREIEDTVFPGYVPRDQVYEAISRHIRPEAVSRVRQDIDNRFPREKFGDVFPYCATLDVLFNTHLQRAGNNR